MNREELKAMIQELAARTERGEVPWGSPPDFMSIMYPEAISLKLPKSRVDVRRERTVGGEIIAFLILNEKGDIVLNYKAKKEDPLHGVLDAILAVTLKRARKVDDTIKDVQDFLKKKQG